MDNPKTLVASGYDAIAERYAEVAAAAAAAGHNPRSEYLEVAISVAPNGGRALDLGCGTGEHATNALAERLQVVGLDISARSVALARQRLPLVAFVVGDMATVSFADSSFDVVTAFYSLIHVPRDEHGEVLRRITRWLRPGGYLIATMGIAEWEGTSRDWHGAPMYWSHYDKQRNIALVEASGLEIVSARCEPNQEHGKVGLWIVARRPPTDMI